MKSLIKKVVGLVMILSAFFIVMSIDASAETMYVSGAETGQVFLRTAPATEENYMLLPNGTAVYSIGWRKGWDGVGYNQVIYNGYTGWITTRYLSYSPYEPSYDWYYGYILGASSGSVYFWKDAYSQEFYYTIPNGTRIRHTYRRENGRLYGYYNGSYGWFTDDYVY